MVGDRSGTSVYCNCHGTERLLDLRPREGIQVVDGRHGTRHEATVGPREMLARLAGTIAGCAIVDYVQSVVNGRSCQDSHPAHLRVCASSRAGRDCIPYSWFYRQAEVTDG